MQASDEGHLDLKVDTDEYLTSARLNEIFGIAPGTRFSGRSDFLNQLRFYGNDRAIYLKRFAPSRRTAGRIAINSSSASCCPRTRCDGWDHGQGDARRRGRARRRVGVFADITARKRAEEALRLSEERYARAMEGSDAGHWDWNIVTDEMFVSERAREMLALPPGALPARRSEIMELVPMHPDDRAAMTEKVNAGIALGAFTSATTASSRARAKYAGCARAPRSTTTRAAPRCA